MNNQLHLHVLTTCLGIHSTYKAVIILTKSTCTISMALYHKSIEFQGFPNIGFTMTSVFIFLAVANGIVRDFRGKQMDRL